MGQQDNPIALDLEAFLRRENAAMTPELLRRFACECSRRVMHLCRHPTCFRLLEYAEERARGLDVQSQLVVLNQEFNKLYHSLYPGYNAPSFATLALSAIGEAAYTDSPLTAAIGASAFAANAMALSVADPVDDAQYDEVYDAAYRHERQAQLELLRQL